MGRDAESRRSRPCTPVLSAWRRWLSSPSCASEPQAPPGSAWISMRTHSNGAYLLSAFFRRAAARDRWRHSSRDGPGLLSAAPAWLRPRRCLVTTGDRRRTLYGEPGGALVHSPDMADIALTHAVVSAGIAAATTLASSLRKASPLGRKERILQRQRDLRELAGKPTAVHLLTPASTLGFMHQAAIQVCPARSPDRKP